VTCGTGVILIGLQEVARAKTGASRPKKRRRAKPPPHTPPALEEASFNPTDQKSPFEKSRLANLFFLDRKAAAHVDSLRPRLFGSTAYVATTYL
jgi:hypothetical protein